MASYGVKGLNVIHVFMILLSYIVAQDKDNVLHYVCKYFTKVELKGWVVESVLLVSCKAIWGNC